MHIELFLVSIVLHYTTAEYYKTKPDFIQTCLKSDPDFDECSRQSVQKLFHALGPGLPEIDVPPLDPMKIPKIRILQGDGPVNVNAALDDVTVTGFGETEVLLSQVDSKTYDFYTRVRVPKIRIEGTYDLKGKILLIPLVGRGRCWFEPKNMTIDIVSDVKLYEKDDFVFFNVTSAHVKYTIGGLTLRMNNLFDGINSLEDSTNAYLNANWRPVSESLRPILSKTIEDILLGFLQQLFHNLPGNFMIGDIKYNPSKKVDKKV
ncbi:circadian clock-controlled protein daywake-like [Galleria mellonella]|uniref:Circadian clock-controlled protein daywake-like n=1 Tax=Galleria mellonella TaxID=7137 RepID=A0A6J1X724_GALME|nr:circadian clock-controlled protein daywake-like [Galleria mellonella]XP_052756084.1 circadian clock-controlled protein daywake-like [Galleria mellonella]XP_052756086.1 circadian clock-controlled protein daywake-like [Galleria mellonella]